MLDHVSPVRVKSSHLRCVKRDFRRRLSTAHGRCIMHRRWWRVKAVEQGHVLRTKQRSVTRLQYCNVCHLGICMLWLPRLLLSMSICCWAKARQTISCCMRFYHTIAFSKSMISQDMRQKRHTIDKQDPHNKRSGWLQRCACCILAAVACSHGS